MDTNNVLSTLLIALNVVISIILVVYLLSLRSQRHRTDTRRVIVFQLLIPLAFVVSSQAVVFMLDPAQLFFAIIDLATVLVVYVISNHSELFFKLNFRDLGEYLVVIQLMNAKGESNEVNIYRKRDFVVRKVSDVIVQNLELLDELSENLYENIFDFIKNHEFARKLPKKYLENGVERDSIIQKFLTDQFSNYFFHQIFFSFYFFDSEIDDLTENIQALIISDHEELPTTLVLSATFLTKQKILNKEFSTIFALEGAFTEEVLQSLALKSQSLEFFKTFTALSDVEIVSHERDFYRAKLDVALGKIATLGKENLTISQKIALEARNEPRPDFSEKTHFYTRKRRK